MSKYVVLLVLRYYQDLSYDDIAEILKCPVGTVKSKLNYALKKLREEMKEDKLAGVGK